MPTKLEPSQEKVFIDYGFDPSNERGEFRAETIGDIEQVADYPDRVAAMVANLPRFKAVGFGKHRLLEILHNGVHAEAIELGAQSFAIIAQIDPAIDIDGKNSFFRFITDGRAVHSERYPVIRMFFENINAFAGKIDLDEVRALLIQVVHPHEIKHMASWLREMDSDGMELVRARSNLIKNSRDDYIRKNPSHTDERDHQVPSTQAFNGNADNCVIIDASKILLAGNR